MHQNGIAAVEKRSLEVLQNTFVVIKDMAADLCAAAETLQVSVREVKGDLLALRREVLRVEVLLDTWHPTPASCRTVAQQQPLDPLDERLRQGQAHSGSVKPIEQPFARRAPWDSPLQAEAPLIYGRLFPVLEAYAHAPEADRPTWLDMARHINEEYGTRFSRQSLKRFVNRAILGRPAGPQPPEMTLQEAATWLNSHFGATISRGSLQRYLRRWRRSLAKEATDTALIA